MSLREFLCFCFFFTWLTALRCAARLFLAIFLFCLFATFQCCASSDWFVYEMSKHSEFLYRRVTLVEGTLCSGMCQSITVVTIFRNLLMLIYQCTEYCRTILRMCHQEWFMPAKPPLMTVFLHCGIFSVSFTNANCWCRFFRCCPGSF